MKCNVGSADKWVRIILGVVIAGVGVYYQSWWGLLAVVPLGTAILGFCPLYALIGFSTCAVDPAQEGSNRGTPAV
jgi:hypothetical protein